MNHLSNDRLHSQLSDDVEAFMHSPVADVFLGATGLLAQRSTEFYNVSVREADGFRSLTVTSKVGAPDFYDEDGYVELAQKAYGAWIVGTEVTPDCTEPSRGNLSFCAAAMRACVVLPATLSV